MKGSGQIVSKRSLSALRRISRSVGLLVHEDSLLQMLLTSRGVRVASLSSSSSAKLVMTSNQNDSMQSKPVDGPHGCIRNHAADFMDSRHRSPQIIYFAVLQICRAHAKL
jgi:hypothetical protein